MKLIVFLVICGSCLVVCNLARQSNDGLKIRLTFAAITAGGNPRLRMKYSREKMNRTNDRTPASSLRDIFRRCRRSGEAGGGMRGRESAGLCALLPVGEPPVLRGLAGADPAGAPRTIGCFPRWQATRRADFIFPLPQPDSDR